jgi:hypothetical protein
MLVQLRRLCAALLAAGAAVAPSSCARNDSSIFVFGALVPNQSDCAFAPSSTPQIWLEGAIDAAYAGEYTAVLQIENQMVPRGDPNTLKTETSGVQLYDAEVQVLDTSGAALTKFSVPVAGFVPPGNGGTPGLGATEVVMIDHGTVARLANMVGTSGNVQQVVSSVIVRGRTLGGLEVHTQEFLFPISVFNGGLCFATPGMPCVGGMASSSTSTTGVCRLGLDQISSCQNIASTVGVCHKLECTTPGDPTTSHCPAHTPPDASCCN